jgi:hypothetical protein
MGLSAHPPPSPPHSSAVKDSIYPTSPHLQRCLLADFEAVLEHVYVLREGGRLLGSLVGVLERGDLRFNELTGRGQAWRGDRGQGGGWGQAVRMTTQ